MKIKDLALWISVPLVAYVSIFLSVAVCSVLLLLTLPLKVPLLYEYQMSIYGGVSAFNFVVSGAYIAPSHKDLAAILLFVLGGYLSWEMLGGTVEEEEYLLLLVTYSFGLIGVVFVHFKLKHNNRLQTDAATPRD